MNLLFYPSNHIQKTRISYAISDEQRTKKIRAAERSCEFIEEHHIPSDKDDGVLAETDDSVFTIEEQEIIIGTAQGELKVHKYLCY